MSSWQWLGYLLSSLVSGLVLSEFVIPLYANIKLTIILLLICLGITTTFIGGILLIIYGS